MLLKAYFALGFTAVAVVGSALPFPDNMESGLSMRSDTDLAFARESGTIICPARAPVDAPPAVLLTIVQLQNSANA
jgi:hypothetical protein